MCTICLQDFDDDAHSELPCGHRFHSKCPVPWLWKHSSCPNCRYTEQPNPEETENENQQQHNFRTLITEIRVQRSIVDTRRRLRSQEQVLTQRNRELNQEFAGVQTRFVAEHKKLQARHKEEIKPDLEIRKKSSPSFMRRGG